LLDGRNTLKTILVQTFPVALAFLGKPSAMLFIGHMKIGEKFPVQPKQVIAKA